MVTVEPRDGVSALGLDKNALPRDYVSFILNIEDIASMDIVVNDDFTTAVLEKVFPGVGNLAGLGGRLIRSELVHIVGS